MFEYHTGERRLTKALEGRPEVEVRWRPFQLQPGMPEGGLPWAEFSRQKFGGEGNAEAAFSRVSAVGEQDGIHFDFGRVASAPNTIDAHRLILFADEYVTQWELADALFRAYFADGRNLNDHEQLVAVASSVGVDGQEVREYLAGEVGVSGVWSSQQEAGRLGTSPACRFMCSTGATPSTGRSRSRYSGRRSIRYWTPPAEWHLQERVDAGERRVPTRPLYGALRTRALR